MYAPEDIHGAYTFYTYSPNKVIEAQKKLIQSLEQKNKELKQKNKELESLNDFLIEGIVRHSIQERLEK